MPTPNENNPEKKPQQQGSNRPAQQGKPAQRPAPKQPGQPGPTPNQGAAPRPKQTPGQTPGRTPSQQIQKKPNPQQGQQKPSQTGVKATDKKPTPKKPGSAPAKKRKVTPQKVVSGSSSGTRTIDQVLVDLGYIDEDQLWDLQAEADTTGEDVGEVAMNRGLINEEQLLQAKGEQFGLKVVNLEENTPQPDATQHLQQQMAEVYNVVPYSFKDNVLTIAIGDPQKLEALDDLRRLLQLEVTAILASTEQIEEWLPKVYSDEDEETIISIIEALENDPKAKKAARETSIDLTDAEEFEDVAPVRKLINMVMLMAIKDNASDIHFEPFEEEYKMRYRADGVLLELVPPPRHLANAIATRIKVMSNLDIAERRLPQDGRIELNVGGNPVDMRVSVLPTMFGESVVIRVLDRSVVSLDINKIGMESDLLEVWKNLIRVPNGIVLVTGPTGSGKTTTLYSSLNELNEITEKVITTEDPIEYDIDGIIQVPINSDIGVTFAKSLRAILRQDPDTILVGEIRDLETAQIAVQAALTGHTVFSTLHTNDAPSTITRLRDMGVEPFLITATVQGILAQRLVRRICEDCKTNYDPSDEQLMELNLTREQVRGKQFYYGRGCERCNNTGHKRRSGLFELILLDDEIRDLISAGASSEELREACRKRGMTTLREAGLRAIFNGVTTIEEVVHETIVEDE